MRRHVGQAIGHGISPVVESLDIDAIVQQINFQELLEDLDWNALLQRVNVNRLLDRIDFDRVILEKVDIDRLVQNIDVQALIDRSDLESIIGRASTGFTTRFLHYARQYIAYWDQCLQRCFRCGYFCRGHKNTSCCGQRKRGTTHSRREDTNEKVKESSSRTPLLPPRPGISTSYHDVWPEKISGFGVAIQLRCCGMFVKLLSGITDRFCTALIFALVKWFVSFVFDAIDRIEQPSAEAFGLCFIGIEILYSCVLLSTMGRTVGHFLFGLLVVSSDGDHVRFCQIFPRSILFYFNSLFFGWVVGIFRRDGRQLYDLITGVSVVFAWDASPGYVKEFRHNNDFVTSIRQSFLSENDDEVEDENMIRQKKNNTFTPYMRKKIKALQTKHDLSYLSKLESGFELSFHDAVELGSEKEV